MPKVDFFSKNFVSHKKKKILDIGAGLGLFLSELKKRWPKANLFAVEPSTLMAAKCRSDNIKVFETTIEKMKASIKVNSVRIKLNY